jgi:hypothetical protein
MFVAAMLAMARLRRAARPAFVYLTKLVTDQSFVERDPEVIRWVPLLIFGIFVVRGIAEFVSTYCMNWVGRQVIKRLRREVFAKFLVLPTRFYDANSSGALLSRLTFNIEQVAQASSQVLTTLFKDSADHPRPGRLHVLGQRTAVAVRAGDRAADRAADPHPVQALPPLQHAHPELDGRRHPGGRAGARGAQGRQGLQWRGARRSKASSGSTSRTGG